jgi:hypothetical protein
LLDTAVISYVQRGQEPWAARVLALPAPARRVPVVAYEEQVRGRLAVIRADFYATAALLGGVALLVTRHFDAGETVQLLAAIVVTSGLRVVGMKFGFSLPKVRSLPASPSTIVRARRIKKLRLRRQREARRNSQADRD